MNDVRSLSDSMFDLFLLARIKFCLGTYRDRDIFCGEATARFARDGADLYADRIASFTAGVMMTMSAVRWKEGK